MWRTLTHDDWHWALQLAKKQTKSNNKTIESIFIMDGECFPQSSLFFFFLATQLTLMPS